MYVDFDVTRYSYIYNTCITIFGGVSKLYNVDHTQVFFVLEGA